MLYLSDDLEFPRNFHSANVCVCFQYFKTGGLNGYLFKEGTKGPLHSIKGMYLERQDTIDIFFTTEVDSKVVFYSGQIVKDDSGQHCCKLQYLEDVGVGDATPAAGALVLRSGATDLNDVSTDLSPSRMIEQ